MENDQSPLQQALAHYLSRVQPEAARMIEQGLAAFAINPTRAEFFRLIAFAPRWTVRQPMAPSASESELLSSLHPNLAGPDWDDDQLARLWIISAVQDRWPAEQFARELDTLFNTADVSELVALYRSLALLRDPQQFIARVREGARTNMVPVFLAVAHHNSFPAEFFDEEGWNQLVLKAIFNACPLDPITGLDARNNPALSHMLSDYVRERWAAGREVPWDIWRCIGPHAAATGDMGLLAQALDHPEETTRLAAGIALRDSDTAEAIALLAAHPNISKNITDLNWQGLAARATGAST